MFLGSLFERREQPFANLFLVPNALANNEAEVKELFHRVRSKGGQTYSLLNSRGAEVTYTVPKGEGVCVKDPNRFYDFCRSTACLKVKEFYSADLRIVGAYEGEPGSKYVGMLGGIRLASDCGRISSDCGSGFDDAQRFEWWLEFLRGDLVGQIVEVSYQDITSDGSLLFPVFQTRRPDKSSTNVE